jgi:hypothetical protein
MCSAVTRRDERRGERDIDAAGEGALRVLLESARQITPVVIDLGSQAPRLDGFVHSVERGVSPRLIVSPVAGAAIPAQARWSAAVTSTDSANPFRISGTQLVGLTPVSVALMLRGAFFTLALPRRAGRIRRAAGDPLVLIAAGLSAASNVIPIIDLGATACIVDSTFPLDPGLRLDSVQIVNDRRVLRHASAQVIEMIPWLSFQGERRFLCRLALTDQTRPQPYEQPDLLPAELMKPVLGAAVALGVEANMEFARGAATVEFSEIDTAALRFHATDLLVVPESRIVRISFDLFEVHYEGTVRLISSDAGEVRTSLPHVMRRYRNRHEARVSTSKRDLEVHFSFPTTGQRCARQVVDLSKGGLCFVADPHADVLWKDLPLDGGVLRWDSQSLRVGVIRVAGVETQGKHKLRCHVSFSTPIHGSRFTELLAAHRYPELEVHRGDGFERMLTAFREGGLLGPHMERNLQPEHLDRVAAGWERVHRGAVNDVRTLLHRENSEVLATVSGIRAWERTWIGQHMVALPRRRWKSPGTLHMSFIDHVVGRSDCSHMVVFVRVGNTGTSAFFDRFLSLTGSPEAGAKCKIALWSHRGTGLVDKDVVTRPLRSVDEAMLCHAARREYGPIVAAALAYLPGQVHIPRTRAAFAKGGVVRQRSVRLLGPRGRPHFALCKESAELGFSLTFLLNATWLLPVHPPAGLAGGEAGWGQAVAAALAGAETLPSGEKLVVTPGAAPVAILRELGLTLEAEAEIYAYNRTGLLRWFYYLHETYGFRGLRDLMDDETRKAASP